MAAVEDDPAKLRPGGKSLLRRFQIVTRIADRARSGPAAARAIRIVADDRVNSPRPFGGTVKTHAVVILYAYSPRCG
jgi:hypothetical protein